MATDGWVQFNGIELINLARTVELVRTLGIDIVRIRPGTVAWIQAALEGSEGFGFGYGGFGLGGFGVGGTTDYSDITQAPWYDVNWPASAEFAGIVPLSFAEQLEGSSLEASVTEYITNGGKSGKPRNATMPLVANVRLVGSTERGVEYGKQWMDRVLRGGGTRLFCAGSDLVYFRAVPPDPSQAQRAMRQNVALTRGSSVTLKRTSRCGALMGVTFTLTADDPFEYGESIPAITSLSSVDAATGPMITSSGSVVLTETGCPAFDYTPVYDPLYPALVAPPLVPNYYPDGWGVNVGDTFSRYWARLAPVEPSALNVVPLITITTVSEVRSMRFSIWPHGSATDDQCDPLFSTVITYSPVTPNFVVDGVQEASYTWDGSSPLVRRSDSLVYSPDAGPVEWESFNDPSGLMFTMDLFPGSSGATVHAALAFVQKSD